ncbi:ribosomal protein L7/L12 [Kwoniella bestiolae CBS 10118]|uniref:Ribosomal protein L7/L12 n=1 Tax=Kwoniella bestiolae CBS 10118 TaxID=1296100 RepID=A0A1B9GC89_9TREE|nr:ribosomal protein L7/L12 [Kwoniella bestiolae CBS 10118]OCF28646.1 ribosomal protein L7/L12 [Kwoniella bestiolae CBS 10118]
MSLPRTIVRSARASSSRLLLSRPLSTSRPYLAEAEASSSAAAPVSPKISPIVDQISGLTLLEVSELVSALKTKLNITEIALPAASAAPSASASAGASGEPAEAAEEKPKEKTIFTVKLEKFDAAAKAKIIREVKAIMPNMNLVEAKKFVESVPQTLKENLPKEEAEKLQKTLTDLGATVSLV